MKKLPLLMLVLIFLFLSGCVGSMTPMAKKELSSLSKGAKRAYFELSPRSKKFASYNEKFVRKEIVWLRQAVNNAEPEANLELVEERYMKMTEDVLEKRLGQPSEAYLDLIRKVKYLIYALDEPGRKTFFLKSLYSPVIRVQKTALQLTVDKNGKIVDVKLGAREKNIVQSVPGIVRIASGFVFKFSF